MTAYPTWTPAARPGIIPLQPLTFGVILGRSFSALRQNPRVLLGFALVVQAVGTILAAAGIVAAGVLSFSRLAAVPPGSDEFETIMAGAIALTSIVSIVLTLAAGALGVIVQAVVVSEVAHAVVAEKLTLGALWRRVKPVAGRLIAYAALLMLVVLIVLGIVVTAIIALAFTAGAAAILLIVLVVLVSIPLSLWLSVKLLLVPAIIVLEHGRVLASIGRSWRLTRGRFWPALGVVVIISLAFGFLAQAVSVPFSLATTGLTTIFTPTGDDEVAGLIGVLIASLATQIVSVLIQSVSLVVQSTASALIYIDCRMRHEGLDLDLLAYVDQRDAGVSDLPDPYRQHIGRAIGPRWAAAPGYGAPPAGPYSGPPYPGQYSGPPYPGQYSGPPYPGQHPGPPYPGQQHPARAYPPPPAQPSAPPPHADPQHAPPPAADPTAPAPTQWAAPGGAERP